MQTNVAEVFVSVDVVMCWSRFICVLFVLIYYETFCLHEIESHSYAMFTQWWRIVEKY